MCIIPGFPAALLDDPPQPQPPPAATREQHRHNPCSSEDEHSPKVRKPYTITKQREKWSDEEHDKFLEAVKMYGRAWRRIEEHVGTKTAVQIRSHAQKFFSKVARESITGDNSGTSSTSPAAAPTAMIIEIPPPRPKKRPLHPYPRKQGSAPNKRPSASTAAMSVHVPAVACQLANACVHHHHHRQEENGSPKSVLSAAAAAGELNRPAAPSKGYGACASSDSSITGPEEEVPRGRRRGNEMADGASTMSNGGSGSFEDMTLEDAGDKDPDQGPPALVSFQLFGQTVVVPNPDKPSSCTEASSWLQEPDNPPPPSSSDLDNSGSMTMAIDSQGSQTTTTTTPDAVTCHCGVLPILCAPLPPSLEQQQQQQQAYQQQCPDHGAAPQPWWFFYGGAVALPFVRLPVVASSQQQHNDECWGTDGESSSGASADSVTRQEASDSPKTTSVDRDGEQSGERSPRSAFSHQGRGFVPYKRQAAAQQPQSPRPCSRHSQNAVQLSL